MEMPGDLTEITLRRNDVYNGKILHVHVDDVRLPNGQEAVREVVDHVDGAAVLAMDEADRVLVVRQYRYPFAQVLTEIPAGKLDAGEEPRTGALRELKEEIGAQAGELIDLGAVYPSPGFCREVLYLYLARNLTYGETCPDEDEFLEQVRIPFGRLAEQVMSGAIRDGKTVAAVLKAKVLLNA